MSEKPVLYGFDGSTYVRTVRMVLNEHDVDYEQVHVNVLKGEPKQPEHLARHPFGKVPVMDFGDLRLRETETIARYVDEAYEGPALVPDTPKDRARMSQALRMIDAYGYGAMIGVAGYHLFPHLFGGREAIDKDARIKDAQTVLEVLIEAKGGDPWLAGPNASLADYLLGPILFYVSLTPDKDAILNVDGVPDWWERMQAVASFKATEPDLS